MSESRNSQVFMGMVEHAIQDRPRAKRKAVGVAARPETWWKPGQSGNPKGRPKGHPSRRGLDWYLARALRKFLVENDKGELHPSAVRLVETTIRKAIEGDAKFAKIIFDAAIPKVIDRSVHVSTNVNAVTLSAKEQNQLIDEARLVSPIEAQSIPIPALPEPKE